MGEIPTIKAVYDRDTYRTHRYVISEGQSVKGAIYVPKDIEEIPREILVKLEVEDNQSE
ncbi:MAG: hypothetical protein JRF35_01855 [Deltaproteobacteria bacterium]|nr:hypothetical protein [Deltaproteobacteria bacterium]MBW2309806.1 hypothetical protein [Deltaproteobacteria bacterium]